MGIDSMCKACHTEKALSASLREAGVEWIGYEAASHVVVAYACNGGGIVATASDEVTAYRIAKLYREAGHRTTVKRNVDETFREVSDQLFDFLSQ